MGRGADTWTNEQIFVILVSIRYSPVYFHPLGEFTAVRPLRTRDSESCGFLQVGRVERLVVWSVPGNGVKKKLNALSEVAGGDVPIWDVAGVLSR